MDRAHPLGERGEQLAGVGDDDQAGAVGVLGLVVRHAEEVELDVLTFHRHVGVRAELVVGLDEAQHPVELGHLVDGPAGQ